MRVVERPLDPFQLRLLHVEHRVGEVGQRAGMVPVPMADDDLGDVAGLDAETAEQIGQRRPVHAVRHLEVVLLLPARVVQDHVLAALDDPDVDGKLKEDLVVHGVGATRDEDPVRLRPGRP